MRTALSVLAVLCFSVSLVAQGNGGDGGHPVVSDPSPVDRAFPPGMAGVQIPSGNATMNGQVFTANGPGPHPTVVMLHGFPGDEKNIDLGQALRRAGFNVLVFHYRGSWGSGGTYSVSGQLDDVVAALSWAASPKVAEMFRVDPTRLMVVGHSMGGFNAMLTAIEQPAVTCTVALDPGDGHPDVVRRIQEQSGGDEPIGSLGGYTRGTLARELLEGQPRFNVRARIGELRGPLLVVRAARPTESQLAKAAEAAGLSRFDYVVIDGDHSFNWSRLKLSHVVVDWMTEHCM